MATSQSAKAAAKNVDLLWQQQANTPLSKQQEERQHVSPALEYCAADFRPGYAYKTSSLVTAMLCNLHAAKFQPYRRDSTSIEVIVCSA